MQHKRLFAALGLCAAAALSLGLAACEEEEQRHDWTGVPVTSITLSAQSLSLEVGQTQTLTATVLPENATDKTLTWTTDNASVATVSGGTVTAVAVGEAVITAAWEDVIATCTVAVADEVISTAQELTAFAQAVNGGNDYAGRTVALGADIDLAEEDDWTAIGVYYYGEGTDRPFSGTFNGNGATVKGIDWNNVGESAECYGGLFGYLANATVKNVTVEANIRTGGWAGILAGRADVSAIENVTTRGSIYGDGAAASVAGICEYLYHSSVRGSVNEASVTSVNVCDVTGESVSQYAAGIVCEANNATIEGCTNSGAITATPGDEHWGGTYIGGIAAYLKNGGAITDNTNTATITVTAGKYCEVGGIVANIMSETAAEMTISGNVNSGEIAAVSDDAYAGGIAGAVYAIVWDAEQEIYVANKVTFSDNANSGNVSITSAATDVNETGNVPSAGGVIGWVTALDDSFVDGSGNTSSVMPVNHTEGRGTVNEIVGILDKN